MTNIVVQDKINDAADFSIIRSKIYEIRGKRVMLDFDLAEMYQVETRRLNEQVKRNIKRFPDDFMFQLTNQEFTNLMSQNATSRWGGTRKLPYAFTEHGIAMLSGLLNSDIAIDTNIIIIRTFIMMRQYAMNYAELNHKLENFMAETNIQFYEIYQALTEFAEQKKELEKPKNKIGFKQNK